MRFGLLSRGLVSRETPGRGLVSCETAGSRPDFQSPERLQAGIQSLMRQQALIQRFGSLGDSRLSSRFSVSRETAGRDSVSWETAGSDPEVRSPGRH